MPVQLLRKQLDLVLFGFLGWEEIVEVGQCCEELEDRVEELIRTRNWARRVARNWEQIQQSVHTLLPNPLFIPTPDIPYSGRHFQLPYRYASPALIAFYTPASSSSSTARPQLPYWINLPIADIEPDLRRPNTTEPPQTFEFQTFTTFSTAPLIRRFLALQSVTMATMTTTTKNTN